MKRRWVLFCAIVLSAALFATGEAFARLEDDAVAASSGVSGPAIMDFTSATPSAPSLNDFGGTSSAANSALAMARWSRAVDHFIAQSDTGAKSAASYSSLSSTSTSSTASSWTSTDPSWQGFSTAAVVLTPVPEPSTYGAVMLGIASLWVVYRRRRLLQK